MEWFLLYRSVSIISPYLSLLLHSWTGLLYVITQRSWLSTVLVLLGGIGIMTLDVPLLFYQVDVFENLYGTYSDHQLHFADWCWMMVRLGIVSCVLFEVSKRFFQRRSLLK